MMMQSEMNNSTVNGSVEGPAVISPMDPRDEEALRYCVCCCCLCHCSEKEYRDLSCFGCFPVKCGIYGIGLLTIFLTICIFLETFMFLLSDHVAWWFVVVSLLLQIPLIIGLIFFLNFFGEDCESTRAKLDPACILVLVSFFLQVSWNIGYFWGLYRQQLITVGNEEAFQYTVNKKQYLFWTTFGYLVFAFAYGYFICVVRRYWYRLKPAKSENDDMEAGMMMKQD